jgi:hypothetical protein
MVFHAFGRAIAQAVSRWLPTSEGRVQARVKSCEICGGQSGTGEGFLRVLGFPLPIFILPIATQSPSSFIWCWYNRPSGFSVAPLRIIKIYIRISGIYEIAEKAWWLIRGCRSGVLFQVWAKAFIFSPMSRQVLRSIEPPVESVRGTRIKWLVPPPILMLRMIGNITLHIRTSCNGVGLSHRCDFA